ncbi:glycosyltransferase family 4 protein [Leptolyngbya sp. 'hensonii']|uniref:glycosyltransferase family 4 protein n=1 Tax=Leptolyngbya sp. 'hensonii' TaxID=1922337 RepID=UPI00209B49B4|nr:glycosyltransferase family 4 protein [Leptolyngbya sp. 'hensonii']
MLSSTFPYPPSRGGTEIRTFNLLKYLSQRHSVTLVTQTQAHTPEADVAALRNWVDELVLFPLPEEPTQGGWIGKVTRLAEVLLKTTPPNVLYRYSPALQQWVDDRVRVRQYDVITCEHSVNEAYIRPEFQQTVPTIVDVHSSVYGWTRNHLEMGASPNPFRDRLFLPILYRYEKRYCAKFSTIVVTTEDDRLQLQPFNATAPIEVIPNGVDLDLFPYRSPAKGRELVFVGAMDASHNIDAARFFSLEVLPQVRQHYPDATFTIVGARPTPEVEALGALPGVTVTGQVPSMVEYLHRAAVCVVPLRTGYGIKNKTLEAMAAGTPVVASDRGLEGLAVDSPLRALRANRVEDYGTAIGQLFENSELRSQLSQNGRALIEAEYTWERAGQRYEEALEQAALRTKQLV